MADDEPDNFDGIRGARAIVISLMTLGATATLRQAPPALGDAFVNYLKDEQEHAAKRGNTPLVSALLQVRMDVEELLDRQRPHPLVESPPSP